jgi:hypothetical protein
VHCPLAPHWAPVEQVPHVPVTHAIPPPHWLLAVQAVHTPLMQARPGGGLGLPKDDWLQSRNLEHAPHAPLTHACPFVQPNGGLQPVFAPPG